MAAVTVISAEPAAQSLPCLSLDPRSQSQFSLSSSSFSLLFHPFLQSFLLFLLLSCVGLSCKCSCWPPILVVLRSLPKSNKHSLVVVSFVVGVRASWGTCCGSFLSLSPPNSTYLYTWNSTHSTSDGLGKGVGCLGSIFGVLVSILIGFWQELGVYCRLHSQSTADTVPPPSLLFTGICFVDRRDQGRRRRR